MEKIVCPHCGFKMDIKVTKNISIVRRCGRCKSRFIYRPATKEVRKYWRRTSSRGLRFW